MTSPVAVWSVEPAHPVPSRPWPRRARVVVRWMRFSIAAARRGWWDFSRNAVRATARLAVLSVLDVVRPRATVRCNVCGWTGRSFYPNTGPGYDEPSTTCPGCLSQDRHRSLLVVLLNVTSALTPGSRVVEVAPMRAFQELFLKAPGVDYTSFDIERHAMERGDIYAMRFADRSVDWFVCFHVLEHLSDEGSALREIHRVLRPGGSAVVQVPIFWDRARTTEYPAPDPREVGHVRANGTDFPDRMAAAGFEVETVGVADGLDAATVERFGLHRDPIYLLRRPSSPPARAT